MNDFDLIKKQDGTYKAVLSDKLEEISRCIFFSELTTDEISLISEIIIPESVKRIEMYAFSDFDGLEEIKIPDSVSDIGPFAFRDCINLRKAKLPEGLTLMKEEIFKNCISLEDVVIPDSVLYIDALVFSGCHSLKEIKLPHNLKTLGPHAFHDCERLKFIELPDTLEMIRHDCFSNCISLKEIDLPPNIAELEPNVFANCRRLETVNFPKNLGFIGYGCFYCCDRLRSIKLPDNVLFSTSYPDAFRGCTNLEKVELASNTAANIDMINLFYDTSRNDNRIITVNLDKPASLKISCKGFEVKDREFKVTNHLFKTLNNTETYKLFDFIDSPSYEGLKAIRNLNATIPLAFAFNGYSREMIKYIKSHISQSLEFISETECMEALDFIIENKLISKRLIDKCLDFARRDEFHEMFVALAGYKQSIDGYDKKTEDRFKL